MLVLPLPPREALRPLIGGLCIGATDDDAAVATAVGFFTTSAYLGCAARTSSKLSHVPAGPRSMSTL
jgi:hypothetical protein